MNLTAINAVPRLMATAESQPVQDNPQQMAQFTQMLYGNTTDGDVGALSPQQMLTQQASLMGMAVGVDLGAKIAGSVSQSVNKLVSMA